MIESIMLETGTLAPEFRLKTTPDQRVGLSDFRGRPVVLMFYQADFSPICGDEVTLFNDALSDFQRYDAQLLGISVDNVWSHLAFSANRNLHFPLLSDFHPKGAVSRQYLAYTMDDGESTRALYVVDREGIIAWSALMPTGISPSPGRVLDALASLDDGRLTDDRSTEISRAD